MPSSDSKQFARLALCSHVLYEREIIEQQREIEALKLRIFWHEYSVRNLQTAIVCEAARRRRLGQNDDTLTIQDWYLWMGPVIQSCGLEVELIDQEHDQPVLVPPINIDVHLACRSKYFVTHYGAKLWKARTVDDPELHKLKALFKALYDDRVV